LKGLKTRTDTKTAKDEDKVVLPPFANEGSLKEYGIRKNKKRKLIFFLISFEDYTPCRAV